jgi:hypothetical protein
MNNRAAYLYLPCVLGAIVAVGGCTSSPTQPTTATTTTTPVVTTTPITLSAPTAIAPLSGSASTGWPTFTVANVTRTGAVGTVLYKFEVSTNSSFTPIVASATVAEGAGQTKFTPGLDKIPPSQTSMFWRVSAVDQASGTTSTTSAVQGVSIDFPQEVRLAAQEDLAIWPGAQPPAGTYGHTSLTGIRWSVQTVGVSFLGITIVSPPLEVLQLIDLMDRGLSPSEAIAWQGSNGYSTGDAVYYPDIPNTRGVVGYRAVYISLVGGGWDLTIRSGA